MNRIALVVDDSPTIRRVVSESLGRAGFEILEAANGKEALSRLEARTVNVIVTDYNMPIMDGLEFVRSVRASEQHKFTPIVFLTTRVDDEAKNRARACGVTAWIVKPLNAARVLAVVQKIVPEITPDMN
jgi:two-component system chemotaxis response regulator CheY